MLKYAEFWGTRRYTSRSLQLKPMGIRRQQKTLVRIQPAHKAHHMGLKAMKRVWTKAAKAAVKRAAVSSSGSGSQPGEGKSMSRRRPRSFSVRVGFRFGATSGAPSTCEELQVEVGRRDVGKVEEGEVEVARGDKIGHKVEVGCCDDRLRLTAS